MAGSIEQLIINSPYEEPSSYWNYSRERRSFSRKEGRRPAGYVTATPGARSFDDPGIFRELPLVNQIRPRVKAWAAGGYTGASGVTLKLLQHWKDPEEWAGRRRFFFCQLEAIETLIWLAEAPAVEKVGIDIPSDGGEFRRICTKMATGSGKTIIMAMLIAWHVLNKATYPQDRRFSKCVFAVAPGLTVRSRLEVLKPDAPGNYYEVFNLIPAGLHEKLRQGRVVIRNWHSLMPLDPDAGPKVVKKGPESDEAFTRRVLGEYADYENWLVINDEAHHAWRVPPKTSAKDFSKNDLEEATQWIGGLDRIHKTRSIIACHDLSATPFAPTGRRSTEETLFAWIVSDFGLNDAIESGLVKTPRVVVRDDGRLTADYKSRLYHIYADPEVKDDISRKAEPHEPLPDLLQQGYYLLGKDWLETAQKWESAGAATPPVMITVANRTETAARIKYTFDHGKIRIDELCAPDKTLHIDSKVLDKAEAREELPVVVASDNEDESDEDESETPTKTVNMTKIVQHVFERIRFENVQGRSLVFDRESPIRATGDMRPWYTGRPCELSQRSHINFCVFDSTWEASEAYQLDRIDGVDAWVKNDHLGFEILYIWQGIVKKYRPDFLVRLSNGKHVVIEVKGQDSQENRSKRQFLQEWVDAVNEHGGFGVWAADVVLGPKEIVGVIKKQLSA
jgi:type III restriction enzyme